MLALPSRQQNRSKVGWVIIQTSISPKRSPIHEFRSNQELLEHFSSDQLSDQLYIALILPMDNRLWY